MEPKYFTHLTLRKNAEMIVESGVILPLTFRYYNSEKSCLSGWNGESKLPKTFTADNAICTAAKFDEQISFYGSDGADLDGDTVIFIISPDLILKENVAWYLVDENDVNRNMRRGNPNNFEELYHNRSLFPAFPDPIFLTSISGYISKTPLEGIASAGRRLPQFTDYPATRFSLPGQYIRTAPHASMTTAERYIFYLGICSNEMSKRALQDLNKKRELVEKYS